MAEKKLSFAEALCELQNEIGVIPKNQTANLGKFKFKYADLTQIRESIRPVMHKWGFSIYQVIDENHLVTTLLHSSGEKISSNFPIPKAPDMKTYGGSLTYLRRYAITAILNLVSEDDYDFGSAEARGEVSAAPMQDKKKHIKEPCITESEMMEIQEIIDQYALVDKMKSFLEARSLDSIAQIPRTRYRQVKEWLMKGVKND